MKKYVDFNIEKEKIQLIISIKISLNGQSILFMEKQWKI